MSFALRGRLTPAAILSAVALVATLLAPAAAQAVTTPDIPAEIDRLVAEAQGRTGALVHVEEGYTFAQGLAAAKAAGLDVGTHYEVIKVFVAYGSAAQFGALRAADSIEYIEANLRLELFTDTSHKATRGQSLLDGEVTLPDGTIINGKGVGVAVVDSGVDGTHPDLADRMGGNVKIVCVGHTASVGVGALNGWQQCRGPKEAVPMEDTDHPSAGGHGTHVAGTVAGTGSGSGGKWHGAAPGATLYGVSIGTAVAVENAMDGLAWVLANHDQVAPAIKVVNNSWGGGHRKYAASGDVLYDALWKMQDALIEAGVTVVFAAGNDGGTGSAATTSAQCVNPRPGLVCVANYDDRGSGTRAGSINSTSSRGKTDDPTTWPDVSAPGTSIVASCRLTLPVCNAHAGMVTDPPNLYSTLSGTSMAAPHVAGIIAQLYQVDPTLTPAEVEKILEDTAHKFAWGSAYGLHADPFNPDDTSSFEKGHGLVDAVAAVQALQGGGTEPTPTATPTVDPSATPEPTPTQTAGPRATTTYYFHSTSGINNLDQAAGTDPAFDTQTPTFDEYSVAYDVPGALNTLPSGNVDPIWHGEIGSSADSLSIDLWQEVQPARALGTAHYNVRVFSDGTYYDLYPLLERNDLSVGGSGISRLQHTYTHMKPAGSTETDATKLPKLSLPAGPLSIAIRGLYSVNDAYTEIRFDSKTYPSGFSITGGGADPDPTPTVTPTVEPTPTVTPTIDPTPTEPPTGGTYPENPNDPLYAEQWGPQQIRASKTWDTATGRGATIAVVDSGVDLKHEDLAGKMVPGATFVCDGGTTSCGNGSWDSRPAPDFYDYHGSHVAGIAAAITDNGVGIAGVAPDARIMPVKALHNNSGANADIARGIRWAADQGADVINLSIGQLPGTQAFRLLGDLSDTAEAVDYANSKGVVVVAAAGNNAFPLCAEPAFGEGVLCVAATDRREARTAYSDEPLKEDLLAVSAPGGGDLGLLGTSAEGQICGEGVLSTIPMDQASRGALWYMDGCGYSDLTEGSYSYDEFIGTSMAAPHVSGVAALLASMGCTREQTLDAITSTARQPGAGVRGTFNPVYGYGIVDAEAATAEAEGVCESPDPEPTPTITPTATPTATPTPTPTDEPTPGVVIHSDEGRIIGSNLASTEGAGVTENEFVAGCAIPFSQGLDGWVFELPAELELANTTATLTGSESFIGHDLDMYFYSEECDLLGSQNTAEADETAAVPDGTRFIVANAWIGADTLAELSISKAGPTPTVTPTVTPSDDPTDPTTPTRGTYPADPNDPLFANQWGMTKIQAPQAWQETNATGFGINIAVVDSGLDVDHEDFACPGKLKVLPGSDQEGNDGTPEDDDGHGTHVAGIAGACTNNGKGVVGVAPDATIMPVRHAGGAVDPADLDAGMARGIRFATNHGAHVINLSIGDIPPFSHLGKFGYPETEAAMAEARNAGVVIAAAAGNFDQPTCEYPSLSRNVICVVATDQDDMRAWYSDFPVNHDPGESEPNPDRPFEPVVAAPGGHGTFCEGGVVSTIPEGQTSTCYDKGYDTKDGTSMSAPHVAGLAALLYDRLGGDRSKATADLIVETILQTSDDLYSPGWDPIVGYGRINALAAVQALPEPVEPVVTTLSFTSALTGQYTDETTVTATLEDADGALLEGKTVTFTLPGGGSVEATTDANGAVSHTFTIDQTPGPHDITVRFDGEEDAYEGSATADTFVVDKEDSATEVGLTVQGHSRTLTARLFDQDTPEAGIGGRTIDFYSDGHLIGASTTDQDGNTTLAVPGQHRGDNRNYEARFAGDEYFLSSSDVRLHEGDHRCTATMPIVGQRVRNITVPAGETCTVTNSTVTGSIKALQNSTLLVQGSTIRGKVEGDKAEKVSLTNNTIGGGIEIEEGETADGGDVVVDSNVLSSGSLKIEKMAGDILVVSNTLQKDGAEIKENNIGEGFSLIIDGNTITRGDLKVEKNRGVGEKTVTNNGGGKTLECKENLAPFTGAPNGTWGKKSGQCAG